ncbi:apolipoprotein D-like [Argopecten irradians]|uniref:apolipoprotein D-like n=1 Tax=Argopecten irradians TaxID=31199 RepID=UPI003719136C
MGVHFHTLFILGMAYSLTTAINLPANLQNIKLPALPDAQLPNLQLPDLHISDIIGSLPQFVNNGPDCPAIPAISNFNLDRYAGKWYEVRRFNNSMDNSRCVSYDLTKADKGFYVDYRRIMTIMGRSFDITSTGIFTQNDDTQPNLFSVVIRKMKFLKYYIVETDYDRFAVVYTCSKFPGLPKMEMGWILSRDQQNQLSDAELSQLMTRMDNLGISRNQFEESSQSSCVANFTF